MISPLLVWSALGVLQAGAEPVVLGETTLAGKPVSIEVPRARLRPDLVAFEAGGLNFVANSNREIHIDAPWYRHDFESVIRDYPAAKANIAAGKAMPWRTKIFVLNHVERLVIDRRDAYRFRRSTIDDYQVPELLADLARFEATAEALTHGTLDVQLDVQFDDTAYRSWPGKPLVDPTPARVNESLFETDSKRYSGPYDCVLVLTSELRMPDYDKGIVPYYATILSTDPHPLSMELGQAFFAQLSKRLGVGGLGGAAYYGSSLATVLKDRAAHPVGKPEQSPIDAIKLPADPLTVLGETQNGRAVPIEQLALYRTDARSLGSVIGYRRDGLAVSGDVRPVPLPDEVEQKIRQTDPARWPVSSDPFAKPVARGHFEVAPGEKFGDWSITEKKIYRRGGVRFGQPGELLAGANAPANQLVFQFKTKAIDPLSVKIFAAGQDNTPVQELVLGTPNLLTRENPSDMVIQAELPNLPFPNDDTWREVRLPLQTGGKPIAAIEFGPPSNAPLYERLQFAVVKFDIASLRLESSTAAETSAQPVLTADDQAIQSFAAMREPLSAEQITQLQAGIAGTNDPLRVNACAVLMRVKVPGSEAWLEPIARSASVWGSIVACQALAHQGTPEALDILKNIVMRGPFDNNREGAVAALRAWPEPLAPNLAANLSTIFAAKDWTLRAEAIRALARIETPESAIMQLTFLLDPEPNTRLAVVETGRPQVETVAKRMLYLGVNDESERVRAGAYEKLLGLDNPSLQAEAVKGMSDDSGFVRRAIVGAVPAKSTELLMKAIRRGLVDRDPGTRVAAIRRAAAEGVALTREDLASLEQEAHPAVLREIAATQGKLAPWPAALVDRLRAEGYIKS